MSRKLIIGMAAATLLAAAAGVGVALLLEEEQALRARGPSSAATPPRASGPDDPGAQSRGGERKPAVVWAVGDGADGGAESKALATRIASERPDRFLYLGDVYDRGTEEEFERNYRPVYGRLDPVAAPTPGNHDWPRAGEGYDPYWRQVRGRPLPPYYSFRAGGWQLLGLNSEAPHEEGSPQLRWLREAVSGAGTCRIAFWHRPRFSAGSHGDQEDVDPLWEALSGNATIVVSGHDHDMQRLRPIDGLTQFVSGAGGKSHYELDERDPRLAFGNDRDDGALRLELRPGVTRYAFVSSSGRVLDSGQLKCRD